MLTFLLIALGTKSSVTQVDLGIFVPCLLALGFVLILWLIGIATERLALIAAGQVLIVVTLFATIRMLVLA